MRKAAMNKIKRDATATIPVIESNNTRTYAEDMALLHAKRVILLEKACRYRKYAHRLDMRSRKYRRDGYTNRSVKVGGGANNLRRKAAELYDQAEAI